MRDWAVVGLVLGLGVEMLEGFVEVGDVEAVVGPSVGGGV